MDKDTLRGLYGDMEKGRMSNGEIIDVTPTVIEESGVDVTTLIPFTGRMQPRRKKQLIIPEGRLAWERLPGETQKAYSAFLIYRDLPAERRSSTTVMKMRRLTKIKEKDYTGKWTPETIAKAKKASGVEVAWCADWHWVHRAQVWDEYCLREEERDWLDRQRMLRKREWDASESLFDKGLAALKGLTPAAIGAKDIATILRLASELGQKTKREPVTKDFVRNFLLSLPEPLRIRVMEMLRLPSGPTVKVEEVEEGVEKE